MSEERVREGVLGAPVAPRLHVIDGGKPEGPPKNAVQASSGEGGGGAGRKAKKEGSGPREDCPLVALGHADGQFVFLDSKGQRRTLSAGALGRRPELAGLFAGDTRWLFKHFPKKKITRKTDPETQEETVEEVVIGINVANAGEFLMTLCGDAGLFGPHVVFREPGTWPDADGAPVVHAGDAVLQGAEWRRSGFRTGGTDQVWLTRPPTPRPGFRDTDAGWAVPGQAGFAAPSSIAAHIQEEMRQLWDFREPGGEIICIGLAGIGYYGAAARWRSNGFLVGGTGSGKSMLLDVMRWMVPQHSHTTDASKPGMEQAIDGRPTMAFIDEAGRGDMRAAQTLLDLVLSATVGEGTKGMRGTADGRGRSFSVICNVVMATNNPPDMRQEHRDRFTIVNLVKPGAGVDNRAKMEALRDYARQHGPALWGRAIEGWPRWAASLAAFRAALGRAKCAAREMDQMGAILASWWVMTRDGVPDERGALEGVTAVSEFILGAEQVARDDAPRRLIQFLSSSLIQRDRSTDVEQVGILVDKAWGDVAPGHDPADAKRLLERYGIRPVRADEVKDRQDRYIPRKSMGDGLWFATRAKPLRELLAGSPFEGDRWMTEMLRLDGAATSGSKNVRVGGVSGPCIWINRSDWEPPDD